MVIYHHTYTHWSSILGNTGQPHTHDIGFFWLEEGSKESSASVEVYWFVCISMMIDID
jgi:hypothetical protein